MHNITNYSHFLPNRGTRCPVRVTRKPRLLSRHVYRSPHLGSAHLQLWLLGCHAGAAASNSSSPSNSTKPLPSYSRPHCTKSTWIHPAVKICLWETVKSFFLADSVRASWLPGRRRTFLGCMCFGRCVSSTCLPSWHHGGMTLWFQVTSVRPVTWVTSQWAIAMKRKEREPLP